MAKGVLLGLWLLVLHVLQDNACVGSKEIFELEKFQNGGLLEDGFLCLSVTRITERGLRGIQSEEIKIPEDIEIPFICRYASEEKAEQISGLKIKNPDREFMEQVSNGKSLFLKGANILNGTVVNTTMFEWGEMKYSALKRKRVKIVISDSNTTVISETIPNVKRLNKTTNVIDRNNIFTTRSSTRSELYTTKSALAFFIISDGISLSGSPSLLAEKVFGGSKSMRSQFIACSNNKMVFNPAVGSNIVNGVVTITVFPGSKNYVHVTDAALAAAKQMGINTDSIDHLLFGVPQGVYDHSYRTPFGAFADTPGSISVYYDDHIYSIDFTVHELGHNIGLLHAGENMSGIVPNPNEYDDGTSMMGYGVGYSCFNGGHTNALGWHKEREIKLDPTVEGFLIKMVGINDIAISSPGDYLVLEIVHGSNDKNRNIFLNYNMAEGFNSETSKYQNEIIVTQKLYDTLDFWKEFPYTELLYHIREGSYVTIPNFSGSLTLMIYFESAGKRGDVDFASVYVWLY